MMTLFEVHIRRGVLVNDDPQRRCYDGCYAKSHMEWEPWELWMKDNTYNTRESAERTVRLFQRDTQQLKVVEVEVI
jgi:hypothetical protein